MAEHRIWTVGAGRGRVRDLVVVAWLSTVAVFAAGRADEEAEKPLAAGRRALEAGRTEEASHHLQNALGFGTRDSEALALLLEASAEDLSSKVLWAHRWYGANVDASGRVKVPRDVAELLGKSDPYPARLASERAAAVRELLKLGADREKRSARAPQGLLVAQWARRVAMDLARGSKALLEEHRNDLKPRIESPERIHTGVIDELDRSLRSALSSGDAANAVRLARSLRGIAVQAGFEDLKGPRPRGLEKVGEEAVAALARARKMLERDVGEPWTLEELEYLTEEEGEAFTRQHDHFGRPSVSVSPEELYRIETECGYQTLLGVTATVEDHHRRLVNWYGKDPFEKVQGTVRIVPESHGLESEGTPFWWAGGMQGGNTTTIKFSHGTIEGIGRTLTHELTHRFDGAIYPGQPAWLTEGKAVWTGGAYGHSSDEEFIDNYVRFGTVESAFVKGYGGLNKLEKLIDGTIEDYRDNYVAGYALYVYLKMWESNGRLLFEAPLETFMREGIQHIRGRKKWFEVCFCDGKEGRPEDLSKFAEGFGEFISGFYWQDRKPFTRKYVNDNGARNGGGYVYDEPTWTFERVRAEPYFGTDQARAAGELLLELGRTEGGIRALVWALLVDGRTPPVERLLIEALADERDKLPSWVLEQTLAFPLGRPATPYPNLDRSLPKTAAYLASMNEAAAAYGEQGLGMASAAFSSDAARLGAWLGVNSAEVEFTSEDTGLHPFDTPARQLGVEGWVEDDLTNYEERRVPDLWYATDQGDLFVGRKRPRSNSGDVDRQAHQRHAFARSERWMLPGTYHVSMSVQLTTSYTNAAVILGYGRRDHNLRFHITAGDFLYAIGVNDDAKEIENVRWRLDGLRLRDGALGGSTPRGTVEFDRAKTSFELDFWIDGPTVHAFVDGERVGTYHTVDGAPIEGHIGFATSMGAVRIRQPTVQRMDRSRVVGRPLELPMGLDLDRPLATNFRQLVNRGVRGLDPVSQGTILIWFPGPEPDEEADLGDMLRRARRGAERIDRIFQREGATQAVAMLFPEVMGQENLEGLATEFAENFDLDIRLGLHPYDGSPIGNAEESPDANRRWMIFVDHANVVRFLQPFYGSEGSLEERLTHWLTVYRDHGRPERELPQVERPDFGEEEGDDGE